MGQPQASEKLEGLNGFFRNLFAPPRYAFFGGRATKRADEYRERAKECRRLAQQSHIAQVKARLLQIADTWDGLAADHDWLNQRRRKEEA